MEMGKIKIEFVQLFFCEFWEKKKRINRLCAQINKWEGKGKRILPKIKSNFFRQERRLRKKKRELVIADSTWFDAIFLCFHSNQTHST